MSAPRHIDGMTYPDPKSRHAIMGLFAMVILLACPSGLAQDSTKPSKPAELPKKVSEIFSEYGLKVSGANLTHELDNEVTKEVKDLAKFKKSLMLADRERYGAEAEVAACKQRISELRKRHTALSAQLANVTDVVTNNRIVGELNTAKGLMAELGEQETHAADNAKAAKGRFNDVQDEFVQAIVALRQKVDQAHQTWENLADNPSVMDAVDIAAKKTGQKLAIKPSSLLVLADRQLKKYEEAVIAEAIPLDNRGGSFFINVVINGKPAERMIVDSGATAIVISSELAERLDIEPKSSDPDILVGLADGRRILAKAVVIDSVRVGKFTAENVECIVLGEQAVGVKPLLGMSFLGKFKFELDAAQSELKLVKVESGEPAPSSGKPKKKTK
jgi:aspartyl protease family protein